MGVPLRLGLGPFRPRLRDPDDDVFHGLLGLFTASAAVMLVWVAGAPVDTTPPEIRLPEPVRIAMIPTHVDPLPTPLPVAPAPKPVSSEPVLAPRPGPGAGSGPAAAVPPAQPDDAALLIALMATRGDRHRGRTSDPYSGEGTVDEQLDAALALSSGVRVSERDGARSRVASAGGRADAGIGELERARGGTGVLYAGPPTELTRRGAATPDPDAPSTGAQQLLARVVRTYARQIKACYEQRLKLQTRLAGRLELRWAYAAGRVVDAEIVDNTTGDAELETCVTRRVLRWRVPEELPDGEVITPFVLTPG